MSSIKYVYVFHEIVKKWRSGESVQNKRKCNSATSAVPLFLLPQWNGEGITYNCLTSRCSVPHFRLNLKLYFLLLRDYNLHLCVADMQY